MLVSMSTEYRPGRRDDLGKSNIFLKLMSATVVVATTQMPVSSTGIPLAGKDQQSVYHRLHAKLYRKKTRPNCVDVSDDEDRRRKTPLKVVPNGIQHQQDAYQSKKKKLCYRLGPDDSPFMPGTSNPFNVAHLQEQRNQLPIAKGRWDLCNSNGSNVNTLLGRDALIQEIQNNDVTVLLGETGSGKTTRKCQFTRLLASWLTFFDLRGPAIHP